MTSASSRPAAWKLLLAFAIIYLVWGSTYLAIRIGVREIPPFLMAGLRFTVAGLAMWAWLRISGTPSPSLREWRDATVLGTLMFLIDYACLFWAEQRVPSGIAAVILAMIPVCITLLEITFLRTQRLTLRLGLGLAVGIIGVVVLMNPWASLGEAPLDRRGVIALLISCCGWSIGTIVSGRLTLQASKPMSAAAQMLSGGVQLLALAAIAGEFAHFRAQDISSTAWLSLVYLIIAGSIVGFTAYVWLLHYESPTKVGTYAYVNPVVAVILGAALGGETVGRRTILGTALILISVVAITTIKRKQSTPASVSREAELKAVADD
ncbi:MAG: Permease of the drug/metabolite transporter superfamily [Acidobacteriaceae bacterium]|nr:Permease of the drug/metabolite transporter superfamily [Acidobacteriaceae bacterium]